MFSRRAHRTQRDRRHGARFAALAVTPAMLAKLFAATLVFLTLTPFTAPFSTCDLTILLGHADQQGTPLAPASPTASAETSTSSLVPSAPPTAARIRLLARAAVSLPHTSPLVRPRSAGAGASLESLGNHAGLTTILRL
jgi:hypothetical protein